MNTTSVGTARVVDEGPHHAVFVKPAGMTVVAGRGVPRPTLLDVAQERFPGARPVHRLDRVTSGLCVVAKTPFGQQALSEAFRRHLIDKRYLALIEAAAGTPAWDKVDIDARLARVDDPDAKKGPMAWQTVDDKGVALVALAVSFPLPQGGRAFVTGPVPDAFLEAMKRARVDRKPIEALVEKFRANVAKAAAASAAASAAANRPARSDGRDTKRWPTSTKGDPSSAKRGPPSAKRGPPSTKRGPSSTKRGPAPPTKRGPAPTTKRGPAPTAKRGSSTKRGPRR